MSSSAPPTRRSRADQTTVRRANLGVVLQQIAGGEPRSRARVAAETGLTRGTVSSLVGELIELDLLRETGEDARSGRVGRPGVRRSSSEIACRDRARGQRRLPRGLRRGPDGDGPLRAARHTRQPASAPGPVLDRIARMASGGDRRDRGARAARRRDRSRAPGLVEAAAGTLLRAPNLGWSELPVADELAARLAILPFRVENEANLAALAEHWQGVARGVENFICVFGEVGVGAGIFVDGELFRGAHGFGGEFGHLTLDPGGPPCECGSRGCLETLVGQEAIARRAGHRVAASGRAPASPRELVRRAEHGDPAVLAASREAGRTLGIGLASAVNLLDLDVVVLGGCFGPLAPWLAVEVETALHGRVLSAAWSACEVRASTFGELAAVRGAAALTLRPCSPRRGRSPSERRSGGGVLKCEFDSDQGSLRVRPRAGRQRVGAGD